MKKHINASIQDMALDVPVDVMTAVVPIREGTDWYDDIAKAYAVLDDES